MADFSSIKNDLDPNVEKNSGGFEIIPEGDYKIVILKDTVKDNKKNTGKIWKLKLQIIEGQFKNKILDDNINIIHNSPICQKIGQGVLRNISELTGTPYPPKNTDAIFGKPIGCHISIQEFTSNVSGNKLQSNNICSYFDLEEIEDIADEDNQDQDIPDKDIPW